MAVPKRKMSKSRTSRRYSKYAFEQKTKLMNRIKIVDCKQCGEKKMAHSVCAECGAYGTNELKKQNKVEPQKELDTTKPKKEIKAEVKKEEKEITKKGLVARVKGIAKKG